MLLIYENGRMCYSFYAERIHQEFSGSKSARTKYNFHRLPHILRVGTHFGKNHWTQQTGGETERWRRRNPYHNKPTSRSRVAHNLKSRLRTQRKRNANLEGVRRGFSGKS